MRNKFMLRFKTSVLEALSPVKLIEKKLNILTKSILEETIEKDSHWLDFGCGLKPFASSFNDANYVGIDVEISGRADSMKLPDEYFDGGRIPYEDGIFDGVLCTQVLEHIENIDLSLIECNRVLKNGGVFIVSVPFVYKEHEQPYDFRRFTSYGLSSILINHGFQITSSIKCLSAIETIATIFSVYISNMSNNKFYYIFSGLFFTAPILFLSKILSKILPDNKELFCALVYSAVKDPHTKK